jgi:hypothetical protein
MILGRDMEGGWEAAPFCLYSLTVLLREGDDRGC